MAFGPTSFRHRWKRPYQFALILYVGLIAGDLLAQKLLIGWSRSGIPWTTAPGLVLLAAAWAVNASWGPEWFKNNYVKLPSVAVIAK